jgi:hypothetical protein
MSNTKRPRISPRHYGTPGGFNWKYDFVFSSDTKKTQNQKRREKKEELE